MATAGREFSFDHYLAERLKFSGMNPQNLEDLMGIVVSLRNKYGIMPFEAVAQGHPVPNALTVSYAMDSITINKIAAVVLDIPRLAALTIMPRGIPRYAQFAVDITLGG
jgi:hypothetical protein